MSDLENKIDFDEVFLVIPAYNEEKTVSAIIEEIVSQGYNVVLVNDGSKDNTREIVEQWLREPLDFEIQYYYKENGGKHTAHNTALEKASGQYGRVDDAAKLIDPREE